jgi:hypothetical protein
MSTKDNAVSKAQAKAVSDEIMSAIKPILDKHGLMLSKTASKYGIHYEIKIVAANVDLGKNGVNLASPEAREWVLYSFQYGLTQTQAKDLLGEVIYTNAKVGDCVLVGYNGRKHKHPVIVKSLRDEKQYFVTTDQLRKKCVAMGAKPMEAVEVPFVPFDFSAEGAK